jgi:deazaflavin-dependent oxidoreductase (nitroreductase family)
MNKTHRAILRATGGRIGWFIPGYRMPVVELTTTGRKSGQPRSTLLTSPLQEGSTVVIVASAGGNNQHPSWYLNIMKNSEVMVSIGGMPAQRMNAEIVSAEERTRLWPVITRDHANYAGYQRKTQREIPLVLLHPTEG